MTEKRHVSIDAHGETLAEATISLPEGDGEAHVEVDTGSGHLPAGARQRLADAVHDVVTEAQADHVRASVPMGDAELVEGVRQHLSDVELRAEESTSIIEGSVDPT